MQPLTVIVYSYHYKLDLLKKSPDDFQFMPDVAVVEAISLIP